MHQKPESHVNLPNIQHLLFSFSPVVIYNHMHYLSQPLEADKNRNAKKKVMSHLALERELGLAVRGHGTPSSLISSLAVFTHGNRLPWLIESLKVEAVEAVVDQGAEAILVEVLCVLEATLSILIVSAYSRGPTSLTVPIKKARELDTEKQNQVERERDIPDFGALASSTSNLLNVGNGLVHVVKVNLGS